MNKSREGMVSRRERERRSEKKGKSELEVNELVSSFLLPVKADNTH